VRAPGALAHPRQLTPRWLTAALDQGGIRADVSGFRWRQIGRETGIGGFVTRVWLRYRDAPAEDAPPSIVIKFPRRRSADAVDFWEAEWRFYRDHAERCPIATPRLYFGALNRRARLRTLVIEDLRAHRPLDDVTGITSSDAEAAVTALARLHAWGRREPNLDWIYDAYAGEAYRRGWYERNVEHGIRRLRGFMPRADLRRLRGLGAHETAARMLLAQEPLTASHQDYRPDNLFLTADQRVVAVDWETIWRYRGGAELGRFLATGLRPDLLRRDGQALIDLYARTVADEGFNEYAKSEIERDVRLGLVRLMIRSVAQMPEPALGRGRPLRVVRTWAVRSTAAVKDLDAMDAFPAEALREAAVLSNGE
jgi:hypothetical protein